MVNSTTKNALFYYRAREVRDIICAKMTQKRLLFDCIERANKLGYLTFSDWCVTSLKQWSLLLDSMEQHPQNTMAQQE
eukprot:scaffold1208_cov174-Skeletonema_menzelii.AAC.4